MTLVFFEERDENEGRLKKWFKDKLEARLTWYQTEYPWRDLYRISDWWFYKLVRKCQENDFVRGLSLVGLVLFIIGTGIPSVALVLIVMWYLWPLWVVLGICVGVAWLVGRLTS